MRKHIHTPCGWLIAVMLMVATTQAAIWPSTQSPASGSYDRGNEALSGAVERLTVSVGEQAWTNYITTNIWAGYFSQASKLKASKAMLKEAINGATWVRPVTNYTPELPLRVTESNVLAWCDAPAGWWTNHPYVNLAAESNGWRFLPDVESNIVVQMTTNYYATNNNVQIHSSDGANSAQSAFDQAATNWINGIRGTNRFTIGPSAFAVTWLFDQPVDPYIVALYHDRGEIVATWAGSLTNGDAFCELMFLCTNNTGQSFSSQGFKVSTNYLAYTNFVRNAGVLATNTYVAYEDHALTEFSTPASAGDTKFKGWSIKDAVVLHRFNVLTNGFKYFR